MEIIDKLLFALIGALGTLFMVRYKMETNLKSEFKSRRAAAIIDVFTNLNEVESLISGLDGLYVEDLNIQEHESNQHEAINESFAEGRKLLARSRFLLGEDMYRLAQCRYVKLREFYKNVVPKKHQTDDSESEKLSCVHDLYQERFEILQHLPNGIYKG